MQAMLVPTMPEGAAVFCCPRCQRDWMLHFREVHPDGSWWGIVGGTFTCPMCGVRAEGTFPALSRVFEVHEDGA